MLGVGTQIYFSPNYACNLRIALLCVDDIIHGCGSDGVNILGVLLLSGQHMFPRGTLLFAMYLSVTVMDGNDRRPPCLP